VKISINRDVKGLGANPIWTKLLADKPGECLKAYHCGDYAISLAKIAGLLHLQKPCEPSIAVFSPRTYADILTDIGALRKYSSDIKTLENWNHCIFWDAHFPTYITQHELVDPTMGYLFSVGKPEQLALRTVTVSPTPGVEIEYTNDLAEANFDPAFSAKWIGIGNS
jgi:hypothetical protein